MTITYEYLYHADIDKGRTPPTVVSRAVEKLVPVVHPARTHVFYVSEQGSVRNFACTNPCWRATLAPDSGV